MNSEAEKILEILYKRYNNGETAISLLEFFDKYTAERPFPKNTETLLNRLKYLHTKGYIGIYHAERSTLHEIVASGVDYHEKLKKGYNKRFREALNDEKMGVTAFLSALGTLLGILLGYYLGKL